MGLNRPRDLSAAFDLDLAVGYRPGNPTGGADQQPLAHDEITFETAVHIGIISRGIAFESSATTYPRALRSSRS